MALLHIALQEGFASDTVVARVAGKEVYRKAAVTTKLQIGRADAVDVQVDAGSVLVEIAVPPKGLAESIQLQVASAAYLGVSIARDGRIKFQVSERPFGYV
jgi:hypothetical protein